MQIGEEQDQRKERLVPRPQQEGALSEAHNSCSGWMVRGRDGVGTQIGETGESWHVRFTVEGSCRLPERSDLLGEERSVSVGRVVIRRPG